MNLVYFRKTDKRQEKLIKDAKKFFKEFGYDLLGISETTNYLEMAISNPDTMRKIISANRDFYSLMPSKLVIIKDAKGTWVGLNHPGLLTKGTKDENEIGSIVKEEEQNAIDLVNEIAGVGKLKPSKIKLYSTTTCPYCKMEDKWLTDNGVEHDMVLVDLNPEAAREMVARTGQMGVPVTEIEYEDADSEFIIGFDKDNLSNILDIKS